MVNIVGNHDGSSAVDYTVNPATGFPWATGRATSRCRSTICSLPGTRSPVRSPRPACSRPSGARPDGRGTVRAGRGLRHRLLDGGNLGKIAEVQINHHERVKDGNYLYGAFGRDFITKDGHRVMVVALTLRQWHDLVEATGLGRVLRRDRRLMDVDLDQEGGRFKRGAARRDAQTVGAVAHAGGAARTFDATACRGGPTRRSPVVSAIPAARRQTRCSRRSSSLASGLT